MGKSSDKDAFSGGDKAGPVRSVPVFSKSTAMAASPKVYYPTTAYDHSFGEEPYEFVTAESEVCALCPFENTFTHSPFAFMFASPLPAIVTHGPIEFIFRVQAAADALVTARSSTRPRPIPIGGSPAALLAPPASVPANWVTMFFADALEQETVDSSPVRDEEMPDRSDNEGEAEGAVSFGDDFAAVDVPFRSSPPRDDAVREYIKMEPVANDSEGEARGNVSFSDGEASESLEESDSSDDVIIVSMIEHKAAADVPHNDMLDAEEEEEAVLVLLFSPLHHRRLLTCLPCSAERGLRATRSATPSPQATLTCASGPRRGCSIGRWLPLPNTSSSMVAVPAPWRPIASCTAWTSET
jgi:hypothetical protein